MASEGWPEIDPDTYEDERVIGDPDPLTYDEWATQVGIPQKGAAAMTRQPATAAAIRRSLIDQYGEKAVTDIEYGLAMAAAPQPAEAGSNFFTDKRRQRVVREALANQPATDPATHDIGGPAAYPDDFPANQPAAVLTRDHRCSEHPPCEACVVGLWCDEHDGIRGTDSSNPVPYIMEAGTDQSARVAPGRSGGTRPASSQPAAGFWSAQGTEIELGSQPTAEGLDVERLRHDLVQVSIYLGNGDTRKAHDLVAKMHARLAAAEQEEG